MRRHRELQRIERAAAKVQAANAKADAKAAEKAEAAHEVSKFENYLDLLTSVHRDCGDEWDWHTLAAAAPPSPPIANNAQQALAIAAMHTYKPGFFEKLFGSDKKKVAQLMDAVHEARRADQAAFAHATSSYREAHGLWARRQALAVRILQRDASVYADALNHSAAFDELGSFRAAVSVQNAEPDAVVLRCQLASDELVPAEEVKLTAAGKLTSKAIPAARYWALYQDHICSCALRVASESFAVLPVTRVIVNVGMTQTNSSNGHKELVTLLAVHFARSILGRLNLDSIDPSDSMNNFPHRMRFKKAVGFESVGPITLDEHWVTT